MDYRSRVRLLFVLLIPVLLAGFALSLAGLEPYPALVFPGFEQAGNADGQLSFEKPEFRIWTSVGQVEPESMELDAAALLTAIPESYYGAVLQNRFRYPNGNGLPEKRLEVDAGGHHYSIRRMRRTCTPEEVAAWSAALYKALPRVAFGACSFEAAGCTDSLVVQWYRYTGRSGAWRKTELDDRLVFDFTKETP